MLRIFPLLMLLLGTVLHAEQLSFRKTSESELINFDYRWLDSKDTPQSLSFALPKENVNQQKHRKFVPELAQNFVYIELLKAARKIDPKEARVDIQQVAKDIRMKVNSRSEKFLQHWQLMIQTEKQQAFDRYLAENHYAHFTTAFGQQGVKTDHLRYINENVQVLQPLATAIFSSLPTGSNTTEYVNFILGWVQSIPYNELDNRLESNGAGYLPPLSVIANNQGDCDSKTTLMATLIRTLLPQVKMVMIYLPNHALLGISLPHIFRNDRFELEGTDYLLMEPTGPATTPLGTLAPQSANHMASGMFSYEEIP